MAINWPGRGGGGKNPPRFFFWGARVGAGGVGVFSSHPPAGGQNCLPPPPPPLITAINFLFPHFSFPQTVVFVSFSKKHRMAVVINIGIFRGIK
ncbi:hypothetical protein R84B8_02875 [Treponema sp. R8-4-B8]